MTPVSQSGISVVMHLPLTLGLYHPPAANTLNLSLHINLFWWAVVVWVIKNGWASCCAVL